MQEGEKGDKKKNMKEKEEVNLKIEEKEEKN
jgi:hypothetical protein